MSFRRRTMIAVPAAGALAAVAGMARAQATPPLRIVVPYAAGGASDRAARFLAEGLQPRLGSTVIVENITGAGGRLAMRQIATQADPNVIVLANPALMVVAPLVYKNNGYNPERDFQPLSQVSIYEFAVAVGAAVPVRELSHLMAWMKANPDKATIGVPATGSLPHFFALMWAKAAGTQVEVIGYKGSAPLATDVIGGHVPAAVDTLDALVTLHESGKLRILATSGAKRALPSVPTFQEAGTKLTATGWNVAFAKASMPAAQAERLSREIAAVMATPAVREKFLQAKIEPVSSTDEQTRRMLSAFSAQWVPPIQQAGLQFE
ncbi:MAG: ABC transporter substrate-binding protein [Burkholderiales bacterium]|nr:ABC transporter substrate-binding protein [Burkholderiales bacterium]